MLIETEVLRHRNHDDKNSESTQRGAAFKISMSFKRGIHCSRILDEKYPSPGAVLCKGATNNRASQGCQSETKGHDTAIGRKFGLRSNLIGAKDCQGICTSTPYSLKGSAYNTSRC